MGGRRRSPAMANGGYGLRRPAGVRMRRWPCRSDDFRAFFHIHEAIPARAPLNGAQQGGYMP